MSKLFNDVRNKLRVHHYALKTEKTYVQWIKRFILFHNRTHPLKMGKVEVEAYLTWLAVKLPDGTVHPKSSIAGIILEQFLAQGPEVSGDRAG